MEPSKDSMLSLRDLMPWRVHRCRQLTGMVLAVQTIARILVEVMRNPPPSHAVHHVPPLR